MPSLVVSLPAVRGTPFLPRGLHGGSAELTQEGTSHLTGEGRGGGGGVLANQGNLQEGLPPPTGPGFREGLPGLPPQPRHQGPGTKAQTPEPTSPQDRFLPVAVRAELGLGGSQGSLVHPP